MQPNAYPSLKTRFLCSLKASDIVKAAYGDNGFYIMHAGGILHGIFDQIRIALMRELYEE